MNIIEVENTLGINKYNIIFYERKGFINPDKDEKGNRSYNDNDLKILKQIKLLRLLDFSVEKIQEIFKNKALPNMEKHITSLKRSITPLDGSITISDEIKDIKNINELKVDELISEIEKLKENKENFNNFDYDYLYTLDYSFKKKINIALLHDDLIKTLEAYAKKHDRYLEIKDQDETVYLLLDGLHYHANLLETEKGKIVALECDEEVIEPDISLPKRIIRFILRYSPMIVACVFFIFSFFVEVLSTVAVAIIFPTLIILFIVALRYWHKNC